MQEDDKSWKSCCLVMDKTAVLFFAQLVITLIIMTFCIVQLARGVPCEDKTYYTSTITLLLGVWVPQPKLK